ncbi:MAG: L,D-transpeptidase family protein [Bacillota bacterium]
MSETTTGYQAGTRLVINVLSRQLHHYRGDHLVNTYPVAVGKPSTPTPTGHYQIKNKQLNPGGVLGTRWLGLTIPGGNYGLHGTNNPNSIGRAVSNGCVRMHNHHVEELFPRVSIGTPVDIISTKHTTPPPAPQPPADRPTAEKPEQPPVAEPVKEPPENNNDSEKGKTYTVQPGDTMWKIARKLNIPLDQLIKTNSLPDPDRIYPGQILNLP